VGCVGEGKILCKKKYLLRLLEATTDIVAEEMK